MKGPNIIRGYWNKPEATAETIVDGWLASGDLGRIDEEGFLYIEDRAKDMVLRAGENVYCAEVESAIYEHGDVYEAAVFGVPNERLGEEVACVILRQPGTDARRRRAAGLPGRVAGPVQGAEPDRLRRRAAAPERLGQDPEAHSARRVLRRTGLRSDSARPGRARVRTRRYRHAEQVLGRDHVVEDGGGFVEQHPDVRVALREVGDDQPAGSGVPGHPPGVGRREVAVGRRASSGSEEAKVASHTTRSAPAARLDGGVAHPVSITNAIR